MKARILLIINLTFMFCEAPKTAHVGMCVCARVLWVQTQEQTGRHIGPWSTFCGKNFFLFLPGMRHILASKICLSNSDPCSTERVLGSGGPG